MTKSFKQFMGESKYLKTPSGNALNTHTGRQYSSAAAGEAGSQSKSDELEYHKSELTRLQSSPNPHKGRISDHEKAIKRLSK
jgi:hypothetical protein